MLKEERCLKFKQKQINKSERQTRRRIEKGRNEENNTTNWKASLVVENCLFCYLEGLSPL